MIFNISWRSTKVSGTVNIKQFVTCISVIFWKEKRIFNVYSWDPPGWSSHVCVNEFRAKSRNLVLANHCVQRSNFISHILLSHAKSINNIALNSKNWICLWSKYRLFSFKQALIFTKMIIAIYWFRQLKVIFQISKSCQIWLSDRRELLIIIIKSKLCNFKLIKLICK